MHTWHPPSKKKILLILTEKGVFFTLLTSFSDNLYHTLHAIIFIKVFHSEAGSIFFFQKQN